MFAGLVELSGLRATSFSGGEREGVEAIMFIT